MDSELVDSMVENLKSKVKNLESKYICFANQCLKKTKRYHDMVTKAMKSSSPKSLFASLEQERDKLELSLQSLRNINYSHEKARRHARIPPRSSIKLRDKFDLVKAENNRLKTIIQDESAKQEKLIKENQELKCLLANKSFQNLSVATFDNVFLEKTSCSESGQDSKYINELESKLHVSIAENNDLKKEMNDMLEICQKFELIIEGLQNQRDRTCLSFQSQTSLGLLGECTQDLKGFAKEDFSRQIMDNLKFDFSLIERNYFDNIEKAVCAIEKLRNWVFKLKEKNHRLEAEILKLHETENNFQSILEEKSAKYLEFAKENARLKQFMSADPKRSLKKELMGLKERNEILLVKLEETEDLMKVKDTYKEQIRILHDELLKAQNKEKSALELLKTEHAVYEKKLKGLDKKISNQNALIGIYKKKLKI